MLIDVYYIATTCVLPVIVNVVKSWDDSVYIETNQKRYAGFSQDAKIQSSHLFLSGSIVRELSYTEALLLKSFLLGHSIEVVEEDPEPEEYQHPERHLGGGRFARVEVFVEDCGYEATVWERYLWPGTEAPGYGVGQFLKDGREIRKMVQQIGHDDFGGGPEEIYVVMWEDDKD